VNEIIVKGLEIICHVGVPDEERRVAQRLLVDVRIVPQTAFSELADEIELTVDYDAAARRVAELAATRPRRLIETLAVDLAAMLVAEFRAERAEVEVRKFILPNAEYVAVRCARQRGG